MKTSLSALSACLVLLLAAGFPLERKGGAQTAAAKDKRAQYAARDDVNIIAHGLLQLGQNLKEHADKTKVQMRDIFTKLKVFNRTTAELGRESQKLQWEGETLRARALEMEQREGQLLNITAELKEKAEEIQQERRTMSERLSRLEQRVDRMLQGHRNSSDAGNIQVSRNYHQTSTSTRHSLIWQVRHALTLRQKVIVSPRKNPEWAVWRGAVRARKCSRKKNLQASAPGTCE